MKNKILPTRLQGNYRNSLGGFSNTSHGLFAAERVRNDREANTKHGPVVRNLDNFKQRVNPYPMDTVQSKLKTPEFYRLDRNLSAG